MALDKAPGPASSPDSTNVASQSLPGVRTRDVLRLAWPTMLSFILNNTYRMNDQFWVQDLGSAAQASLGSSFFVLVMNFSVYFLAIGGVLPLVAQAVGAGDLRARDGWIRHGLTVSLIVSACVSLVGLTFLGEITGFLGLTGEVQTGTSDYLRRLYWFTLPMALAPTLESVFISMGNTRMPLIMQFISVCSNFVLNPLFIFGKQRFEWFPFEAMGIEGAATATILSRTISSLIGLSILRFRFKVHFFGGMRIRLERLLALVKIGMPNALSIAAYAGVYWVLMSVVVSKLGDDVIAALGIGLTVFEGVSFPIFLGISLAGSSLIGRSLGARNKENAIHAVRQLRWIGTSAGLIISLLFLVLGPVCIPLFTEDPVVIKETLLYVRVLAVSQVFVAHESIHEKILLGSGHTRLILWISLPGNAVRIPVAWFLAMHLEMGALGVWWAINASTLVKASAFFMAVRLSDWTRPLPAAKLRDA